MLQQGKPPSGSESYGVHRYQDSQGRRILRLTANDLNRIGAANMQYAQSVTGKRPQPLTPAIVRTFLLSNRPSIPGIENLMKNPVWLQGITAFLGNLADNSENYMALGARLRTWLQQRDTTPDRTPEIDQKPPPDDEKASQKPPPAEAQEQAKEEAEPAK